MYAHVNTALLDSWVTFMHPTQAWRQSWWTIWPKARRNWWSQTWL